MTSRDDARRRWQTLAAGSTPDAETLAWLQRVAAGMLAADACPDGNTRHLSIVEASGLSGHRGRAAGLPIGLALRGLQTLLERPAEPIVRLDEDDQEIDEHVTTGQTLTHDRAHAQAQHQAARDPLRWLAVATGVWKQDEAPDDIRRDTFRRRVNRYLQSVGEPARAEFKALLQPSKSGRT